MSTTPTTPPNRSPDEIKRDIEQARGQLTGSLDALRGRVNDLTDWRGQLQKHRGELIVGAAVTGFVIGGLIALRRRG